VPDRHILLTGLVMGEAPLGWRNSTLLTGDARESVARRKQQSRPDLIFIGSGELTQSWMQANLTDEYVLLIHPLAQGMGRRLCAAGASFTLQLTGSKAKDNSVVTATFRPVESEPARRS
jgi:dihydrofolate reductase